MPKVSIREFDRTGGETFEELNYTVLIPGPKLYYKKAEDDPSFTVLEGLFTLASQIESLNLNCTDSEVTETSEAIKKELGYLMTVELLKRGLSVQFVPAYTIDEEGNFDESLYLDYRNLFKQFNDKGKYDLRFITIGGITHDTVNACKGALICAGDRGDAVAILNVPDNGQNSIEFYEGISGEATGELISISEYSEKEPEAKENYEPRYGFKTYVYVDKNGVNHYSAVEPIFESGEPEYPVEIKILDLKTFRNLKSLDSNFDQCVQILTESETINLTDSDEIDAWVNDTFGILCDTTIERTGVSWKDTDEKETYGRYGAIFSPYVATEFKVGTIKVPAGFHYLACFANYISKYKSWFAMSGSVRGVSPYSRIMPDIKFGDADVNNVFQIRTADKEGHVATDVICEIRPYGNVVWGNRTMHPLSKPNNGDANAAIQLTASSFLNIRQLCCDLKKTLYRAARQFTFEPNSDALWYNFKAAITPLLDEMKSNQGIRGYQIIRVQTNKKALLKAVIRIVPIEAVEDFDLTVELNDSIEVTE